MSEWNENVDLAVEEASQLALPTVGTQLREARVARGLELSDVAQTLKLGLRQVEAVEADAWDSLPGQTFIRGFVRNYARLVQIDSAVLMAQLDEVLTPQANTLDVPDVRPTSMPQSGGGVSKRDRMVVMFGVGMVVLAALAYFLIPNDLSVMRQNLQSVLDSLGGQKAPAPVAVEPVQSESVFPPGVTPQQVMNPQAVAPVESTSGGSAPVANETPAAPQVSKQEVVAPAVVPTAAQASPVAPPQIRVVFDKESWLEVRDRDNKVIFSQRGSAGSEQQLSGQGPMSLTIGFAPGVHLYWRGQAVDLVPHTKGDVARLVLE